MCNPFKVWTPSWICFSPLTSLPLTPISFSWYCIQTWGWQGAFWSQGFPLSHLGVLLTISYKVSGLMCFWLLCIALYPTLWLLLQILLAVGCFCTAVQFWWMTTRVSVRFHRFKDTIPKKTIFTSGSLNLSLGLPAWTAWASTSAPSSPPMQLSSQQAQPASSAPSVYLGTRILWSWISVSQSTSVRGGWGSRDLVTRMAGGRHRGHLEKEGNYAVLGWPLGLLPEMVRSLEADNQRLGAKSRNT